MKGAFNGHCNRCDQFRPRCATVHMRLSPGPKNKYGGGPVTLCDECRRRLRGTFKMDKVHK